MKDAKILEIITDANWSAGVSDYPNVYSLNRKTGQAEISYWNVYLQGRCKAIVGYDDAEISHLERPFYDRLEAINNNYIGAEL